MRTIELDLTGSLAHRSVRLRPLTEGDQLRVHLTEIPSSGFRWTAELPSSARCDEDTLNGDVQTRLRCGAGRVRTMQFTAVGMVDQPLRLRLARAFGDRTPAQTVTVYPDA